MKPQNNLDQRAFHLSTPHTRVDVQLVLLMAVLEENKTSTCYWDNQECTLLKPLSSQKTAFMSSALLGSSINSLIYLHSRKNQQVFSELLVGDPWVPAGQF